MYEYFHWREIEREQWKPVQRHSPAKLPGPVEQRPESRRLLKWREFPLWQAGEIALKRHSHRASRGRTCSPTSCSGVAERWTKGVSHVTGGPEWQQDGQPSKTKDRRVSVRKGDFVKLCVERMWEELK